MLTNNKLWSIIWMWLGINAGEVMLGNLIWRLSGAATSSYLFSLLIQVAPPSHSKTHLRLCGCLLYWCIHFVAVTKGPSCLSSLASFFFHPYLHVDWAKDLHCSMSIRSAMHPPTSNPPRFLVSRHTAISWVASSLHDISALVATVLIAH